MTASNSPRESALVQRLAGRGAAVADAPPSVWFMRQAGRSLPEYRKVREGIGMLESCLMPELAAEITLQPVRRHGVDAGIFFSDIMVPLKLAGIDVSIEPGVGPVLAHPVRSKADIDKLPSVDDVYRTALEPIREAVRLTVAELGSTPLIGFCGAPFTVASYMVEGRPSRDHLRTRALMSAEPELWGRLAQWVADISGEFLRAQVEAGASAVQLFDSWAGSLSEATYRTHVLPFSTRTFTYVQNLDVPRTHFGVGTGHMLTAILEAGATTVGLDHPFPPPLKPSQRARACRETSTRPSCSPRKKPASPRPSASCARAAPLPGTSSTSATGYPLRRTRMSSPISWPSSTSSRSTCNAHA